MGATREGSQALASPSHSSGARVLSVLSWPFGPRLSQLQDIKDRKLWFSKSTELDDEQHSSPGVCMAYRGRPAVGHSWVTRAVWMAGDGSLSEPQGYRDDISTPRPNRPLSGGLWPSQGMLPTVCQRLPARTPVEPPLRDPDYFDTYLPL